MADNRLFPGGDAVFAIAHRGARSCAPENTLDAARRALEQGARMWELDVGLTADGIPVVVHDDSLERTTDVSARREFAGRAPWRVCDLTLDEIRRLDAGSWFVKSDPFGTIASGELRDADLAGYADCRVPTLEEALRFTRERGWLVNVELKDHSRLKGHSGVTAAVLARISDLDMVEQVLFSSFQHRYLAEARILLPELPRGVLVEELRPDDPLALCRKYAAAAYHPGHELVAARDVARLRSAGIMVNVWTVNDIPEMQALLQMGVNGLITDFPARAQTVLADRERTT